MSTPTEENTPSIGEVLYDQFQKLWPTTPATWNYLSDPVQEIYEKCASAVIDHFKSSTVKQADPWKLPEPPAGMKWHREEFWTEKMLPHPYRPLLVGEEIQPEDEFENGAAMLGLHWKAHKACAPSRSSVGQICTDAAHVPHRTRRPLPRSTEPFMVLKHEPDVPAHLFSGPQGPAVPADPVGVKPILHPLSSMSEAEKLTIIDDYASQITDLQAERDQLRKEVEGLKEKLSAAQVDKELLKDLQQSIGDYSNRTAMEISRSVQTEKEYRVVKGELDTALAKLASFQWKPVPVGGITRTDPENKLSLWISKETSETGLEWVHGISNRATHYVHVETLRELLIIPPVPAETETEEQKMRREFEEWVDRENVMLVLSKLEHSGCYTSTNTQSAWAAWQAALASRKDKPQTTEEV